MKKYKIYTDTLTVNLETGPDIRNISDELREVVASSGISTGIIHVFVIGSTGSITTIEYESGVISDLKRGITSLAPPELHYAHEEAWQDGNGHSHVQAALVGPSLSLPVRNASILLGTWQQVVVINHDNSPRRRNIEVTVTGQTSV